MEIAHRRGALIALGILSVIWGANWIVMKSVLAFVGPLTFSALRYVFGTLVLFFVLRLRNESLAPPPWRDTLLIGLAQTTGFQILVQFALLNGGAGKTALLAYTMPFWVIPLAWMLFGDRPDRRQWTCVALAAIGLLLILEPWVGHADLGSSLVALAGGLSWAIGTVLAKRLFQRVGVSPLRLTAWQMAIGTAFVAVIASCVHERSIEWSPPLIGALIYNGVFASGIAWALWLFIVHRLPANVAGLASLITPLVGVLCAWLWLGERPDAAESAGIAIIAVALLGVLRAPRPSPA